MDLDHDRFWWISISGAVGAATAMLVQTPASWRAGAVMWLSGAATAVFVAPWIIRAGGIASIEGATALGYTFGLVAHILVAALLRVVTTRSDSIVGGLVSRWLQVPKEPTP